MICRADAQFNFIFVPLIPEATAYFNVRQCADAYQKKAARPEMIWLLEIKIDQGLGN
jgi:hypothetical protein